MTLNKFGYVSYSHGLLDLANSVSVVKEQAQYCCKVPLTDDFVEPAKKDNYRHDRTSQENPALRPTGVPQETLYPFGSIRSFHF